MASTCEQKCLWGENLVAKPSGVLGLLGFFMSSVSEDKVLSSNGRWDPWQCRPLGAMVALAVWLILAAATLLPCF